MAVIQKQRGEDLVRMVAQTHGHIVAGVRRICQRIAAFHGFEQMPPRDFQHGLQLHVLGRTQTFALAESGLIRAQKAAQITELSQQIARQIDSTLAFYAGPQKNRQQFGIGQRGRAAGQQFLARPFVGGPLGDGDFILRQCKRLVSKPEYQRLNQDALATL